MANFRIQKNANQPRMQSSYANAANFQKIRTPAMDFMVISLTAAEMQLE